MELLVAVSALLVCRETHMTTSVRLLSPSGELVVAEFNHGSVREREPSERVHLRQGDDKTRCLMCSSTGIWVEDTDRWVKHPFRCDPA